MMMIKFLSGGRGRSIRRMRKTLIYQLIQEFIVKKLNMYFMLYTRNRSKFRDPKIDAIKCLFYCDLPIEENIVNIGLNVILLHTSGDTSSVYLHTFFALFIDRLQCGDAYADGRYWSPRAAEQRKILNRKKKIIQKKPHLGRKNEPQLGLLIFLASKNE